MKARDFVIILVIVLATALATHYLWPRPELTKAASSFSQVNPAPNSKPHGIDHPPSALPPALLSLEFQAKISKARQAAFAANPALKTEEEDLNKQRAALIKQNPPASSSDRTALIAKWRDHAQRMRVAMVKADPSLQAQFAQVDAKLQARQMQMQQ